MSISMKYYLKEGGGEGRQTHRTGHMEWSLTIRIHYITVDALSGEEQTSFLQPLPCQ